VQAADCGSAFERRRVPDRDLAGRARLGGCQDTAIGAGNEVRDGAAVGGRRKALPVGRQIMQNNMLRRCIAEDAISFSRTLRAISPSHMKATCRGAAVQQRGRTGMLTSVLHRADMP
jgi:hypothetical protein